MKDNRIIKTIQETALHQGDTLCFDDLNKSMSYLELENKSNALAQYLEENFPNKQPIIVYGGQEAFMLVAFLACTKSGHAYVPIDDHTPKERVSMIYSEADSACVLALSDWPLAHGVVHNRSEILLKSESGKQPSFKHCVSGDDIYYIIFTSGTTGKPKGVQITYDNLISFTDWMLLDFGLKPKQRFLCQAPFSFDLSVMDVYPALLLQGTLVSMPKQMTENFPLLFQSIPNMLLNVWVSTPSLVEMCLLSPDFNEEVLPDLKTFLFCGEELPKKVAEKLVERFSKATIFNTYGPTETTVAITEVKLTSEILANYDRVPLGKVKSDTNIFILDDSNNILNHGEIGEIIIAGPSVSPGYFENPEKTEEAFFMFNNQPAYRTGDSGLLEDGFLFYKGRMDFQIKLNGFRMELGDIDHHLTELPGVRLACTVPKMNKLGKVNQLVAYIVLEEKVIDTVGKTKELKADLKELVMDYMIPQRFVYVEELPLTPNGKVDRKFLINEVNG